MVATTYRRFDAAEFLETEEDIEGFLDDSAGSGDPAVMLNALATVARARNMKALAEAADISRSGLYKALSPEGNPSFALVDRIARTMGYRVSLVRCEEPRPKARKRPAKTAVKRKAAASRWRAASRP